MGHDVSEGHISDVIKRNMLPLGTIEIATSGKPAMYRKPLQKSDYAASFEELPKQHEPAQAVPVEPSMAPASSKHSAAITYGGVSIEIEGQMVDATAMWRACGAPENLRPSDWLALPSTGRYLEKVCEKLNAEKSGICKSAKGRGGGTSMHRLVALHYAGALDVGLEVEIKEYYLAGYDRKHAAIERSSVVAELIGLKEAYIELATKVSELRTRAEEAYAYRSEWRRELIAIRSAADRLIKKDGQATSAQLSIPGM